MRSPSFVVHALHRRRLAAWSVAIALIAVAPLAAAIMAGAVPDSPAARVDANTAGSRWAGVGSLNVRGGVFTASAIGRRHLLTAAHVVSGAAPADVEFVLNIGGDATHRVRASRIHVHPGYVGFNNPNLNDDIAVVELEADLPAACPLYTLHAGALAPGALLTLVGYGASGQGSAGYSVTSSPTIKRSGQNRADRFQADDDGSGANEVFLFDFDGGAAPNAMGGATLGNAIETSLGGGDSGSAAFIDEGGVAVLAGINTFVGAVAGGPTQPGVFGTVGGGQLVAAYRNWILAIVGTAAAPPAQSGDSEVPMLGAWGLLALAGGLAWALARRGQA